MDTVSQCLHDALHQLHHTWARIGYTQTDTQLHTQALTTQLSDVFVHALQDTQLERKALDQDLDHCIALVHSLCDELGSEEPEQLVCKMKNEFLTCLQLDHLDGTDMTLINRVQYIHKIVDSLERKKIQRRKEIQSQYEEYCQLHDLLNIQIETAVVQSIECDHVSFAFLRFLKESLKRLKQRKMDNETYLTQLQDDFLDLVEELEFPEEVINNPVDIAALQENILSLGCSDSATTKMIERVKYYDEISKERLQNYSDLRLEILPLWDLLNVSKEHRSDVEQKLSQRHESSLSNISLLEEELANLLQLKQEKMKEIIEELREKIKMMWEVLKYPESMRNSPCLELSEWNNETLDAHEKLISKLECQCQSVEPLFDLIKKREDMASFIDEVEAMSSDPQRFQRRDSYKILKKEAKARSLKEKKLPAIDRKLTEALKEWEEEFGEAFYLTQNHSQTKNTENQKRTINRSASLNSMTTSQPIVTDKITAKTQRRRRNGRQRFKSPKPYNDLPYRGESLYSSASFISDTMSLGSEDSGSLPRYLDENARSSYQESIQKLTNRIHQCPQSNAMKLVDLLYERAALYQKLGEFSSAMKDTSRALKLCER